MTTITIGEAKKLYMKGVSPSLDCKNLIKDFVYHVQKNHYNGSVTKTESFESTFHLRYPPHH